MTYPEKMLATPPPTDDRLLAWLCDDTCVVVDKLLKECGLMPTEIGQVLYAISEAIMEKYYMSCFPQKTKDDLLEVAAELSGIADRMEAVYPYDGEEPLNS